MQYKEKRGEKIVGLSVIAFKTSIDRNWGSDEDMLHEE